MLVFTYRTDSHPEQVPEDGRRGCLCQCPEQGRPTGRQVDCLCPEYNWYSLHQNGPQQSSIEIIKQLFDVASLFDRVEDMSAVRATFEKIAPIELSYRRLPSDNLSAILDDVLHTSEIICTNVYSKDGSFESTELAKGVSQIHDLIISENYTYYSAVVNAAKAAYLATLLKFGVNEITRYDPSVDLSKMKLLPPISPLISKIKSFRPEAYFYWIMIGELLQQAEI